jgi:hypothetical protein
MKPIQKQQNTELVGPMACKPSIRWGKTLNKGTLNRKFTAVSLLISFNNLSNMNIKYTPHCLIRKLQQLIPLSM